MLPAHHHGRAEAQQLPRERFSPPARSGLIGESRKAVIHQIRNAALTTTTRSRCAPTLQAVRTKSWILHLVKLIVANRRALHVKPCVQLVCIYRAPCYATAPKDEVERRMKKVISSTPSCRPIRPPQSRAFSSPTKTNPTIRAKSSFRRHFSVGEPRPGRTSSSFLRLRAFYAITQAHQPAFIFVSP